jgi:hypothetical protein
MTGDRPGIPMPGGPGVSPEMPGGPGVSPEMPGGPGVSPEMAVEPLGFYHPLAAGAAEPGPVQPAGGPPFLEEEPALWPDVSGQAGN